MCFGGLFSVPCFFGILALGRRLFGHYSEKSSGDDRFNTEALSTGTLGSTEENGDFDSSPGERTHLFSMADTSDNGINGLQHTPQIPSTVFGGE